MFPLLFREEETCVKVCLHLFYIACCIHYRGHSWFSGVASRKRHRSKQSNNSDEIRFYSSCCNLKWIEIVYVLNSIIVFAFPYLMHFFVDVKQAEKFEFLPLLLYSVYCSCGNMYAFCMLYRNYLITNDNLS